MRVITYAKLPLLEVEAIQPGLESGCLVVLDLDAMTLLEAKPEDSSCTQ